MNGLQLWHFVYIAGDSDFGDTSTLADISVIDLLLENKPIIGAAK